METTRRAFTAWMAVAVLDAAGLSPPLRAANPTVVQATPAPEWEAPFAGKKGWIGGDCVYSAPLGPHRAIWLFGDSFVGTVTQNQRKNAVMVNNAVAIQTAMGKNAAIRFVSPKNRDDKPKAFFTPPDGKSWFWTQAAIQVNDRLLVFLPQIEKAGDGGALGFKHVGQWLAVIDNPQDRPEAWRVTRRQLPFAEFGPDRERSWGSALLLDGDYLYIYGYDEERGKGVGKRQMTVARTPARTADDFQTWRFRTADGWSEKPARAAPQANGLATEFSVSQLPGAKGCLAVYTENGLGDRIVGRFAATPHGPWSDPVLLYRCPEMQQDKGVFSYAAKAHPWAASENQLLISYCVNAWKWDRLMNDEKIYRPKFVRVELGKRR